MSQMGNDLFTINAPMAPVVDVVMPPLIVPCSLVI